MDHLLCLFCWWYAQSWSVDAPICIREYLLRSKVVKFCMVPPEKESTVFLNRAISVQNKPIGWLSWKDTLSSFSLAKSGLERCQSMKFWPFYIQIRIMATKGLSILPSFQLFPACCLDGLFTFIFIFTYTPEEFCRDRAQSVKTAIVTFQNSHKTW